jgi:hypothetical protein
VGRSLFVSTAEPRYALVLFSNSPTIEKNKDQPTGLKWRYLNLHDSPFHFPVLLESRKDHYPDVPFSISLVCSPGPNRFIARRLD